MDAVRVALLRELLAGTHWPAEARRFAAALRSRVVPQGGGLLLVGTRAYEPWHLAAHLTDEAAWSGLPALAPTLVRHSARPTGPAHLAVGLARLEAAGRGETLLVVAPGTPDDALLERVRDARRAGATVLVLDGGDRDLGGLAHETLTVGGGPAAESVAVDLDTVQHLVSTAVGEGALPVRGGRSRFRDRLARLAEHLAKPPPARW